MKRWLLAALLVLAGFTLAAAETVEEKYPSGKVKLKYATDKDGKKDGFFVEYFENGKVKSRANYKADERDGAYTVLYPNGVTQISALYKKGKLHGLYTERDEKGKLRFTVPYVDGKLHGTLKQYEKGKEAFTYAFKNGEPAFARTLEETRTTLAAINTVPESEKKADAVEAERMAALRRLKSYRYLVGVPYKDMVLDSELNRYAEAGAQLCEKIGRLDHTPANPGLPEEVYKVGYKGTSSSNLHQGGKDLAFSIDSYMNDSDPSNIDRVGHRRWCINPAMQRTGLGRSGRFMAMWSFDKSRANVPDYDFIAYPSPGFMPVEYFKATYAWNVSLNPKKFAKPAPSVKCNIYEEIDQHLNKSGGPLSLNYSNVSMYGAGIPYCLIFRPDSLDLSDGKRYWIEIEGLQYLDGKPANVRYMVIFVNLQ